MLREFYDVDARRTTWRLEFSMTFWTFCAKSIKRPRWSMMGRFGILAEVFSRCLLDLVRCSNEVSACLVASLNRSRTIAGILFCCQGLEAVPFDIEMVGGGGRYWVGDCGCCFVRGGFEGF